MIEIIIDVILFRYLEIINSLIVVFKETRECLKAQTRNFKKE